MAENNLGEMYINLAREYMLGSANRYCDRKKVVDNLKLAHELGNDKGSFFYALQFFEGVGVDKNIKYAEGIVGEVSSSIEKNADAGQADYILILAYMYAFGLGKPRLGELAFKHYIRAAELGNLEAMCNLGYVYSVGQGIEKNLEKSFYWYKKSAELGYLHSMRDVGQSYYFGIGTAVNYKKAVRWFLKAAEQNYSHATCDLALCYLEGRGVEKSLPKAAETYLLAIRQDESRAIRDLISHSIDVNELLQNGKIKNLRRNKIDVVDCNVFVNGTIVINAHIKSVVPSVFYDHADIAKFFVEKDNPYFKAYGGVLYSKDGETLIRFPLGSPISEFIVPKHVRHIGAYAFQNCQNLQIVILHDKIKMVEENAFDGCNNLSELRLS
jgi:TPR repeat protein